MLPLESLKSELFFAYHLLEAGLKACAPVRPDGAAAKPPLAAKLADCRHAWTSAAAAAAVGGLGTVLFGKRKSLQDVAFNGLIAASIGFAGALAWGSRERTAEIAHQAARNMGAIRDSHWLERYPIDYA